MSRRGKSMETEVDPWLPTVGVRFGRDRVSLLGGVVKMF